MYIRRADIPSWINKGRPFIDDSTISQESDNGNLDHAIVCRLKTGRLDVDRHELQRPGIEPMRTNSSQRKRTRR